jgi:hypothetical protein
MRLRIAAMAQWKREEIAERKEISGAPYILLDLIELISKMKRFIFRLC